MRSRSCSNWFCGVHTFAPVARIVIALADGRGFQLHRVPLVAQGLHQNGFDDEQDILARGVMGAEL